MLSEIKKFMNSHPKLLKRALICGNVVVAWTSPDQQSIAKKWRALSNTKLRMIPTLPLEGGWTQEHWNGVWDSANVVCSNIRVV